MPWPCEHPERVSPTSPTAASDALRAEVGIEPFADHVAGHAPA